MSFSIRRASQEDIATPAYRLRGGTHAPPTPHTTHTPHTPLPTPHTPHTAPSHTHAVPCTHAHTAGASLGISLNDIGRRGRKAGGKRLTYLPSRASFALRACLGRRRTGVRLLATAPHGVEEPYQALCCNIWKAGAGAIPGTYTTYTGGASGERGHASDNRRTVRQRSSMEGGRVEVAGRTIFYHSRMPSPWATSAPGR